MFKQFRKIISLTLIATFTGLTINIPQAQAGEMVVPVMPKPGTMVHLSPAFTPAHLKGIIIHPDNALQFDFLIHKGDGNLDDAQKRQEYKKLVKYFLASLTVPDNHQWVNLSPYEKDRILENDFGKTEMGRDLLSQDYLLKQITSSLIYPESGLGKSFWDKVYERAYKEYGTTQVPVNTFNKVWIVPDEAAVYERGNTVYVLRNHLKVMMEEDYLALNKNTVGAIHESPVQNQIGSQIIREIILPEIEKEVNEGKNFAMLRQIYSGMILATWYKRALKESLLGRVYANKARVNGVDHGSNANEETYQKYLAAFKKGVFNYIKEDEDKYSKEIIPRKYFSGGALDFAQMAYNPQSFSQRTVAVLTDSAQVPTAIQAKIDPAQFGQEPFEDNVQVRLQEAKAAEESGIRITGVLTKGIATLVFLTSIFCAGGCVNNQQVVDALQKQNSLLQQQLDLERTKQQVIPSAPQTPLPTLRPPQATAQPLPSQEVIPTPALPARVIDLRGIRTTIDYQEARAIGNLLFENRPKQGVKFSNGRLEFAFYRDLHRTVSISFFSGNLEPRRIFEVEANMSIVFNIAPDFFVFSYDDDTVIIIDRRTGEAIGFSKKERNFFQVMLKNFKDAPSVPQGKRKMLTRTQLQQRIDDSRYSGLIPEGMTLSIVNEDPKKPKLIVKYGSRTFGPFDEIFGMAGPLMFLLDNNGIGILIRIDEHEDKGYKLINPEDLKRSSPALYRYLLGDDLAMRGQGNNQNIYGGIDLDSSHIKFRIESDGKRVPLPVSRQDMAQLAGIQGFEPQLIEITSAVLPMLGELRQKFGLKSP